MLCLIVDLSVMLQEVLGAPECMSFVFNEDGKVSSFTGGYIMDRLAAAACSMQHAQAHRTCIASHYCWQANSPPGTAC